MITNCNSYIILLLFVCFRLSFSHSQIPALNCECMDYWECAVVRKGQISSYCGISDSEVCCFLNANATSIENSRKLVKENNHEESISRTVENNATTDISCGVPAIPVSLNSYAEFREWPWHVAVLQVKDDLYLCGGALVARNKVITGAHCVISYNNSSSTQLKIRAGEFDVSGNHKTEPHTEVLVKNVWIHPNFTVTLENDIAILILNQPLNFAEHIRPVCLPLPRRRASRRRSTSNANKTCIVTGWGRTSEESSHSTVLKEVAVQLWSHEKCEQRLQKNFGSRYKLPRTAICASDQMLSGQLNSPSICDGDGGGPLVCLDASSSVSKWYLEGIVSFGIGCGRTDSPGVYTRVVSFINFIKNFIS